MLFRSASMGRVKNKTIHEELIVVLVRRAAKKWPEDVGAESKRGRSLARKKADRAVMRLLNRSMDKNVIRMISRSWKASAGPSPWTL